MPPSDLPITRKTWRPVRPIRPQSAPVSLRCRPPLLDGRLATQRVNATGKNDPAECIPAHSPAQSGMFG